MPIRRVTIYPLCLLVGASLVTLAAMLHPQLSGDGAEQLATIARSAAWPAIHWAFLFGFPLALTGLVGLAGRHGGTPGDAATRAGLLVGLFAYAAWTTIVTVMLGAGATLAQSYATAAPGPGAAPAVFVYEALRSVGLAAQRVAGFALGIATYLFGRGVLAGGVLPRWLGRFGIAAGLVGLALALAFDARTRADEAAFVLPVAWQLAAAVTMLARRAA